MIVEDLLLWLGHWPIPILGGILDNRQKAETGEALI